MGGMFQEKVSARMAQVEKREYMEGSLFEVCIPLIKSDRLNLNSTGYYTEFGIGATLLALLTRHGPSTYALLTIAFSAPDISLRYLVLNRNGSANELETSARNFNPLALFNEMKSVFLFKSSPWFLFTKFLNNGLLGYKATSHISKLVSEFVIQTDSASALV
jgi:hypothetical protein